MIHGLTLKEYVEEEKTKIRDMTKQEKIAYFKEYYLKTCIVILVIIGLLAWIIIDIALTFRETISAGGVVNLAISDEGVDYMTDAYFQKTGLSKTKNKIDFATDIYVDSGEDVNADAAFEVELATDTYDYLITEGAVVRKLSKMEYVNDLEEVLTEELLSRVTDKLFYLDSEGGKKTAAAVNITDTAFAKAFITGGDVYFVITEQNGDYSKACKMLEYILDYRK